MGWRWPYVKLVFGEDHSEGVAGDHRAQRDELLETDQ